MSALPHGLFQRVPRPIVVEDMVERAGRRLSALPQQRLASLLEDALYNERKRLERAHDEAAEARMTGLARSLVREGPDSWIHHGLASVRAWADEIHGHFDPRVYRFATRILPKAMAGLLSSRGLERRRHTLDPSDRLRVEGELDLIRTLADEATLVLVPTHVSNLDSPIIGLALHMAGLPPFVYGAGLNLFSNPVMGWWMHRLGAYTVDRTKKARLYKQVLTDYSVRSLTHRHHSLFFPGGTRARSGSLEPRLKKGLLGTAVVAWQEMLQAKRADSEVYIVPMTLSFQLVLEAATLIDDHLSEAGKQRYIISDDEFTKPRRLLAFANRVLDLDASVVARFGAPMDCLGNPVPSSAKERREATAHRRRYVTNAEGEVEWDAQRDRVYTDRLSKRIVEAYPRSAELMATHLAANAAWSLLEERLGSHDLFRLVRCPIEKRRFARWELIARLRQHLGIVGEGVAAGQWHHQSGQRAAEILAVALDRFGRYHRSRALHAQGAEVVMQDPKLCLYYRNRAKFIHEET